MTYHDQTETPLAYVYDGTLEGLLCAIFDCYARKERPCDVCTPQNLQLRLGQVLHEVVTDMAHAQRVQRGLVRICGANTFDALRIASVSDAPDTGTICVDFALFAMARNKRRWKDARAPLFDATMAISDAHVQPLFALHRSVKNEREYMVQFLRFEELEGDVWFARCSPKASVVPLLMDYFAARFNTQAFVIYDDAHQLAGVYEGGSRAKTALPSNTLAHGVNAAPAASQQQGRFPHWYLVKSDKLTLPQATENEEQMRDAWRRFYRALSVEDRYHPELRRQNMPVRFWANLTEMQPLGA